MIENTSFPKYLELYDAWIVYSPNSYSELIFKTVEYSPSPLVKIVNSSVVWSGFFKNIFTGIPRLVLSIIPEIVIISPGWYVLLSVVMVDVESKISLNWDVVKLGSTEIFVHAGLVGSE